MKPKICIVVALFYPDISNKLIEGAINEFKKFGIPVNKKIIVPGIFEIPVAISKAINSFDAFIALGCVIKGQTPHFNFISKATMDAIMHLSIIHKKPIGNGIITCLNKKQAFNRSDKNRKNKGREAARAVLSVLGIQKNETK